MPEDLEELVDLGIARKERFLVDHLYKNAADRPHVNRGGVVLRAWRRQQAPGQVTYIARRLSANGWAGEDGIFCAPSRISGARYHSVTTCRSVRGQ